MASSRPTVSVVVVSYNTRQMTLACLSALYEDLGDVPAEVWVVDNASSDGSPDAIRVRFPQVRLIANDRNVGFGVANNQAIAQASGEFVLLLNSDAFPKPGAVRVLVDYLRHNPRVGVVGPRLLNADGSLQTSCFRFPSPARAWLENLWVSSLFANHPVLGDYRSWAHDAEREVDWVIGACLLARREVCQQVGGFDERFFMYAEETDWQRRIRQAGWEIGFTPKAEVVHFGGASGAAEKPRINRRFFESLDRYEQKHHGWTGLVLLRAAMVVGCSIRTVLWTAALASPTRRPKARAKVRLLSWLTIRQLTCWSLSRRAA